MRKILLILILTITTLTSLKPWTNPVYITGRLERDFKDTSIHIEGLHISVTGNGKILAKTQIGKQGQFELSFSPKSEETFDFFCTGYAVDSLLIASVRTFKSDTPYFTFYLPAKYKKNILGQTVCLKCNKADMVYKIRYGDGLPTIKQFITEQGDTVRSRIVDGHYNAGTDIVGLATYYCERDKVEF